MEQFVETSITGSWVAPNVTPSTPSEITPTETSLQEAKSKGML